MIFKVVFLIVLACAACTKDALGHVSGPPQPSPTAPTTTPATSTTPPTTTTSVTTTPPTTTTTTPPTTTTTTTTTTTPPPTTTSPTTTTTPATSTTPVSTTSVKPTPVPEPEVGTWNVTNNKLNMTFILAEMAVQLNITYDTTSNKTGFTILDIPKNASANGTFGNDTQILSIVWFNKDNSSNEFIVSFNKSSTDNRYVVSNITVIVNLTKEMIPDMKDKSVTVVLYNNKTELSAPLKKSYLCAREQTFDLMKDGSNGTGGTIKLSHVHVEAFHENMDKSFDAAEDCDGGSSPDIVPIVVGCALVGLVAIVLIAYLVGRRRSQARGYLSM